MVIVDMKPKKGQEGSGCTCRPVLREASLRRVHWSKDLQEQRELARQTRRGKHSRQREPHVQRP